MSTNLRGVDDQPGQTVAAAIPFGRADTRHSFVIGGYQQLMPFVAPISNYERFDFDVTLPSADMLHRLAETA